MFKGKAGGRGAVFKKMLLGKDREREKRGPTALPGTRPNTKPTSWSAGGAGNVHSENDLIDIFF